MQNNRTYNTFLWNVHYHLRAALVLSLPAGIAAVPFLKRMESLFVDTIAVSPTVWVIENPFAVTPASAASHSVIDWFPFLAGILLFLLAVVAGIKLLGLARHLHDLSKLRNKYGKTADAVWAQLSESNLRLLKSTRFHPRLVISDRTSIPYTFGSIRPHICLPESLIHSPQKMNMAVRHELIHIKRGDSLLNTLLMLTITVFWFIPVLHLLFVQLKMYRELSCDQEVLNESDFSRKAYAELLFELAQYTNRNQNSLLGMSIEPSILKKRIQVMNKKENQHRSFKKSFGFLLVTILGITVAMSCSDIQSSKDDPDSPAVPTASEESSSPASESDATPDQVFTEVDEMPELIGGFESLFENLTYPEEAREAGIEGRVVIQFIINEQGQVENPQVVHGIGGGCDEAALQAIKDAQFEPGMQNGIPVKVEYAIPISFRLDNDNA